MWDEVPPAVWLEAQILQESSGNPRARRYEPALDKIADGDTPAVDDGEFEDDASYGLLQVLGSNLRAQLGIAKGVRMSFAFAFEPAFGLICGVRHLAYECLAPVDGDVARALARYNGGPGGTSLVTGPGGVGLVLRRQDYVDAVRRRIPAVVAEVRG
jgi:soluble lytic murein transglycosylase-like protein